MTPYAYVKNAPTTHIDPNGEEAIRWPPKDYWQEMKYGDLERIAPNDPEKGFEKMFARYYKQNSSYTYSSSPKLTTTSGTFKPDGKSKYNQIYFILGKGIQKRERLSLFEVTTAKKNVGALHLNDKKGQLQKYIDYLYLAPENQKIPGAVTLFDKQGRFNLITLPEIKDISDITNYGNSKSVEVIHYVPYYRLGENGKVDIEFRKRVNSLFGNTEDKQLPWKPIQNNIQINSVENKNNK